MMRLTLLTALLALVVMVGAGPASARLVDLGKSGADPVPSCPGDPCLAISRTSAFQVKVGPQRDVFTVPEDGQIVAWSMRLSEPSAKQIEFFKKKFGPPSAGISIMRPGKKLGARLIAESPVVENLDQYFGQTVQFPLKQSIEVKKGNVIGLSVPTWAPALAIGFGGDTSWRATRPPGKCEDTENQTVLTEVNTVTRFTCLYRTARLTYGATLITTPVPNGTSAKRKVGTTDEPADKAKPKRQVRRKRARR